MKGGSLQGVEVPEAGGGKGFPYLMGDTKLGLKGKLGEAEDEKWRKAFQTEGMAWAKTGRYEMRNRKMGMKHAPGDGVCEGPEPGTRADGPGKRKPFGLRPHCLKRLEGNPGVGVPASLTSTWDLTAPINRKKKLGRGEKKKPSFRSEPVCVL